MNDVEWMICDCNELIWRLLETRNIEIKVTVSVIQAKDASLCDKITGELSKKPTPGQTTIYCLYTNLGFSLCVQCRPKIGSHLRDLGPFWVASRPRCFSIQRPLWALSRPGSMLSEWLLSSSRFLNRTNSRKILKSRHSHGNYLLRHTADAQIITTSSR